MTGRHLRSAVALLPLLGSLGCLMPTRGTPVFVDVRAGRFWTGEAVLLEVTPDNEECYVAVRDRALIVRKLWVECKRVHPKKTS